MAETVLSDIDGIINEFGKLGLSLNSAKCEIFFNKSITEDRKNETMEKLNVSLPGIKVMTEETFILLGAPITDEAVVPVLTSKYNILQSFFEKVSQLNTHMAFFYQELLMDSQADVLVTVLANVQIQRNFIYFR